MKHKAFRDRSKSLVFSENVFCEHYKFSAEGILQTYGCIRSWCHKMTVTPTVYIALHFFATGIDVHSVGDAENQDTACHNFKG